MKFKVGMEEIAERLEHYRRMSLAGIDEFREMNLGRPVFL